MNRLAATAALFCLALVACGQPAEDEPPPGEVEVSSEPVILPAEARQIAEEWNEEIARANATLDLALQGSLETSPARDIDDAVFERLIARGETTLPTVPRSLEEVRVFVPRQTDYPAQFLAFVRLAHTEDQEAADLLRLRSYHKDAADEPWKLALYVNLPQDYELPEIALDGEGFARIVEDDSSDLKLDPARVPSELAEYLSSHATEPESSIFAPGSHTTEESERLREATQRANTDDRTPSLEVRVTPGDFPVQAFATAGGGALVLFDHHLTSRNEAPAGSSMNTRNASALDGLLEPGSYTTIQRNQINMVTAFVPSASSEELVQIIGSNGGTVSVDAT